MTVSPSVLQLDDRVAIVSVGGAGIGKVVAAALGGVGADALGIEVDVRDSSAAALKSAVRDRTDAARRWRIPGGWYRRPESGEYMFGPTT